MHEVVDFVDSGEVIKKEEEKSVQEADQIAKPEDGDEGVQMREDDDGGDPKFSYHKPFANECLRSAMPCARPCEPNQRYASQI